MYNIYIKKKKNRDEEVAEVKEKKLQKYLMNREIFKNEAKLINDDRRKEWVDQILKNKFTKNLFLSDQSLANEFILKLRERRADLELTKNGFTKYSYEKTKDRTERVHRENQSLFLSLKEHYKGNQKLKLRNRRKNYEVHAPFHLKTRNENDRLSNIDNSSYHNEGFNMSFYSKYKFRDEASPDDFVDKGKPFCAVSRSVFNSFEKMRRSAESCFSKSNNIISAKKNLLTKYEPYIDGYKNIGESGISSMKNKIKEPSFKTGMTKNTITDLASTSLRDSNIFDASTDSCLGSLNKSRYIQNVQNKSTFRSKNSAIFKELIEDRTPKSNERFMMSLEMTDTPQRERITLNKIFTSRNKSQCNRKKGFAARLVKYGTGISSKRLKEVVRKTIQTNPSRNLNPDKMTCKYANLSQMPFNHTLSPTSKTKALIRSKIYMNSLKGHIRTMKTKISKSVDSHKNLKRFYGK
ncbi:unnamed protein product [Moneuplotes crassus]|uniref:Uncharacterized protein n=1 Tax=Euplotes crassus TaxID=5936 RepID=A0AAD1X8K6_EUPCR|nr:unnamed protein product [Moneuplotes crassus]